MYQTVSSGRSAIQIVRYCMKARYDHASTSAISTPPRSCNAEVAASFGSCTSVATATASAIAARIQPVPTIIPNVDECQCGVSDTTQSTDAVSDVSAYTTRPDAAQRDAPSGSSMLRMNANDQPIHSTKYATLRTTKNALARYQPCWRNT